MTIGCNPGGSATVLAASCSMGTAGESPAACTCELRLYPRCPSNAAGVTKPGSLGMVLLLVCETSIVHSPWGEAGLAYNLSAGALLRIRVPPGNYACPNVAQ